MASNEVEGSMDIDTASTSTSAMEKSQPVIGPRYQLCWTRLASSRIRWPALRPINGDNESHPNTLWLGTGQTSPNVKIKDDQVFDFGQSYRDSYSPNNQDKVYQEAVFQAVQIVARAIGMELTESVDWRAWASENMKHCSEIYLEPSEAEEVMRGIIDEKRRMQNVENFIVSCSPKLSEVKKKGSKSATPSPSNLFYCQHCPMSFTGQYGLTTHVDNVHGGWRLKCLGCDTIFGYMNHSHVKTCPQATSLKEMRLKWFVCVRIPSLASPGFEKRSDRNELPDHHQDQEEASTGDQDQQDGESSNGQQDEMETEPVAVPEMKELHIPIGLKRTARKSCRLAIWIRRRQEANTPSSVHRRFYVSQHDRNTSPSLSLGTPSNATTKSKRRSPLKVRDNSRFLMPRYQMEKQLDGRRLMVRKTVVRRSPAKKRLDGVSTSSTTTNSDPAQTDTNDMPSTSSGYSSMTSEPIRVIIPSQAFHTTPYQNQSDDPIDSCNDIWDVELPKNSASVVTKNSAPIQYDDDPDPDLPSTSSGFSSVINRKPTSIRSNIPSEFQRTPPRQNSSQNRHIDSCITAVCSTVSNAKDKPINALSVSSPGDHHRDVNVLPPNFALIKCLFCPFTSESKADMEDHFKLHGNLVNQFPCRYCTLRAASQDELDKHLSWHFTSTKKDTSIRRARVKVTKFDASSEFQCVYCSREFTVENEWLYHQQLHLIVMPHSKLLPKM